MDGTAVVFGVCHHGGEVFDAAFDHAFLYVILEFLLTATNKKNQAHRLVIPAKARTVNLP